MPLIARQLGALALLIAVLVLIDRSAASAQYTLTNNIVNPSDVRELFARDIREFGGVDAYARLAFAMQGLEIEEQHEYAHTFGHELYAVEGEQGIGACDARFAFGCFHQFLGEAIGDLGTTSVGRLYDACATITGTRRVCQHGIGHGVLSAIGYDEADLKGALELCNSVTRERTYAGCVGGAFMEYNLRIIASAEGIQGPREFSGDMYAPCTSVSSLDQKTCTFWLPQWWLFFVLHNDRTHSADNPAYKSMKKLSLDEQTVILNYKYFKSGPKTAKHFKCSTVPIYRILRKHKIPRKTQSECARKYTLNHNYFNKINTEDKAYFLGLICSDGYIYTKWNVLEIQLQERDNYILKKLSFLINST